MTKTRYYGLVIFLAILGLILSLVSLDGMPKRERLIHVLADALLIAAILALTVDGYLKKWLLKEASLDIFQFMLGFQLPRGVTDRIKVLVEKGTLLRRDCELRWRLEWVDESKKCVWCRLETTYNVENLSHTSAPYEQKTVALDPNDPSTGVLEMWCHSWDGKADYHHFEAELALKRDAKEDEVGDRWVRCGSVDIPSRNREREMDYKFGARYISKYNPVDDDQFVITVPTLNIRVVVEAPPDFYISVDPKADRSHIGNAYGYSRLFVDNESVTLRWRRQPQGTLISS